MIDPHLLVASGKRGLAGMAGELYRARGSITVGKAAKVGVDSNLWAITKHVADHFGIPIYISSIDTGRHVEGSRHYEGRAEDWSKIGTSGGRWRPATLKNAVAVTVVHYLLDNGFRVGEGGPWAAILFGPPHTQFNPSSVDHSDHLHVSLPHAPGAPFDEGEAE